MKNICFITSVLFIYLFFIAPHEGNKTDDTFAYSQAKETVVLEKSMANDMRHHCELISKDLKNSSGMTQRRTVQTISFGGNNAKASKNILRNLHDFRMKERGQLQKVSEFVMTCQTLNYYALLCRKAYHVYTLRKLII